LSVTRHPGVTGAAHFDAQRCAFLALMKKTTLAVAQHAMRDDRLLMYRETVTRRDGGMGIGARGKTQQGGTRGPLAQSE
jgi:hypothetical protein